MATTIAAKKSQPPSVGHALYQEIEAAKVLLHHLGDILGDDVEAQADAVEGQTQLREVMARAVERVVALDALIGGIDEVKKNLSARAARLEAQRDNIRVALVVAMEEGRVPRLETALGTLTLKSTPRQVDVVDEALIPSKFWKASEPRLDKRAVLAALKAGDVVLGAVLDNGGQSIMISPR